MLLFMFFQIASVKVPFIASFHFANVVFSLLFFWDVGLRMLLEIGSGSKGFAAFIADEGFFVFVDFFVSVEIWLLIKTLRTIFVITWIWFFSSVDNAMTDEARLKVESFIAFVVGTLINFWVGVFILNTIIWVKLIILLSLDLRVATSYNTIVHAIARQTEVLLGLVLWSVVRMVISRIIIVSDVIDGPIMLIWVMAIIGENVGLFGEFLMGKGVVGLLIGLFSEEIEGSFVGLEVHSLECWSCL